MSRKVYPGGHREAVSLCMAHKGMPARSATSYHRKQNPRSARRNNFPGEQISRRFLLLSESLFASNYPGTACSKDTGLIQPEHDGVMRAFVDGLRLGLHATYPVPSVP